MQRHRGRPFIREQSNKNSLHAKEKNSIQSKSTGISGPRRMLHSGRVAVASMRGGGARGTPLREKSYSELQKGKKKPQGVVLCRYLCLGVMQRQSSNAVEPMLVLSSHRDYYCSQLRLFPANLEYWCPLKQSMGWWVRRWWVMVPALTRETWHALSVWEAAGGTLLWGSPSLPPQVHAPRCQFLALCLQGKVL